MKRDTTSTDDDSTSDIDDIVKRLTCTSDGCEVNIFRKMKLIITALIIPILNDKTLGGRDLAPSAVTGEGDIFVSLL